MEAYAKSIFQRKQTRWEVHQKKKITFCPTTYRCVTPGFTKVYDTYEHFVQEVDAELARHKDEEKAE